MRTRALLLPPLLLLSCHSTPPPDPHPIPELTRYTSTAPKMGTTFRIILYAPNLVIAQAAFTAAWARIDDLNASLSDYDPESELSCLPGEPSPTPVSPDLWTLFLRSAHFHALSAGAFDITVGPYVRLWRRAFRRHELPSPEALANASQAVGFHHLQLHPETRSVSLDVPGMRLDLGGIAKGYALDETLATLATHDIHSALVDGGGDVAVSGPPPGRPGWTIYLEHRGAPPRLVLSHAAVATSGDTYQNVVIDGVRYSHLVDPATGLGLTHRTSVSVIAPDATTADACASAASVMGAARGVAWIDALPELEAFFAVDEKDGVRTCHSTGFERMMALPRDLSDPQSPANEAKDPHE